MNVYPFGSATSNMFNVRYQMSLHDYFGVNRSTHYGSAMGMAGYDSTKRFISLVEDMFETDKNFRFSKVTNKLYIDNSSTTTPLIYGDFDTDTVTLNGDFNNVGSITSSNGNNFKY